MTEFVCRRTGRTYRIGEQLDHSGRATVHAVEPASSNLAVKQYLPETLQKRPELEARIKAMVAGPPAYRTGGSDRVSCAWPEDIAYVSDRFVGFVMPRVDIRGARTVHDVATSNDVAWRDRVVVAENLARAVALLHDDGVIVGEFRESDLLTWKDGGVTLLGSDRMQIVDPVSRRQFPCTAARDGVTPPELHHDSLSLPLRTSSNDVFPLAVHLHLLLLEGAHPFRGEWRGPGDEPAEAVLAQRGLWSYTGDPRLAPYPAAPPLAVLPPTLQRYFRAAFVDGARNPEARPPAREWATALAHLRQSLVTCGREPSHAYGNNLAGCPWCPAAVRSPSAAERPAARGYIRRPGSPRPPATVAGTSSAPVPTASADPGRAPGGTRRTTQAPTLPVGQRPSHPPPGRPPASARRRITARAAVWAAVALVGIGGAIGVASTTSRSAPVVTDPAAATSTRTPPAPRSSTPRPDDPGAALEQIRAQDAAAVETLAESWVAQLSARPATLRTADPTANAAAILAGHDSLRARHPDAVLVWSPDWNYEGQYWITVVGRRFPTAEQANEWCDTHEFAPRECFAKRLSHSGVVDGTARYRG